MPRASLAALTPSRWLRLPARTVRLRLTLLYGGLFFISGVVLLAITYVIFRRASGVNLIVPKGPTPGINAHNAQIEQRYTQLVHRSTDALHHGLLRSVIVLAIMTAISLVLGWLVAGRVLRPLRTMTATTRQISEHNLNQRLALPGPRDELKELGDTVDGLLARLQAHVTEQQRLAADQQRFAANASHELRTPLAITQTLLDVARADPDRHDRELVDRLHAVNARAIDLTEALLLLSRAGQRSYTPQSVDLSLLAEDAIETLLPLAEKHGVTIATSAGTTPTAGSPPLLLQLTTNLLHNAIIHNLPDNGTVRITTSSHSDHVQLTIENTGEKLSPQLVATLDQPFQRGTERIHTDHAGAGLGLAIAKSITQAHDGTLSLTPRAAGGLRVTVRLPVAPTSAGS